jgi:hypothetical protein
VGGADTFFADVAGTGTVVAATLDAEIDDAGVCVVVTLIQSGSVERSKGVLGRLGLSTHPSPGGFGISTLDDAL